MYVGVVGPLEVRKDDLAPVFVPGARERLLLALLVARSPGVVGVDELADALWNGTPPDDAAESVHTVVLGLRAALEPGLPAKVSGRYVLRRGPGYALAVQRVEIDAERFVVLTGRAQDRLAAGDAGEAGRLATAALALWRGEPYADWPDVSAFDDERRRLHAARALAEEAAAEAGSRPAAVPAPVLPPLPAVDRFRAAAPVPVLVPRPAAPVVVPAPRVSTPVREPEPVRRAEPDSLDADRMAPIRPRRAMLLALVLVATLVAAVLAVRSQQVDPGPAATAEAEEAEEATPRDDAERLIDLSVTDGPLDVSLLLAVAAVRLHESAKTRNALRAVLMAHPRADRIGRIPGTPQGVALSGTGSLVVVTHVDVVSWQIDEPAPPQVLMPIPRDWGIWAAALPSPTDDAVIAVGQSDEVPWVRMVSAVDGESRILLVGDGAGGVPLDGAVTPDGDRVVLLVAEPVGEAPAITTQWQLVELDLADGSVRETGIRGAFPAPLGALGVDFASDAGSAVVWDRTSDSVTRVDLATGRSTPIQVAPNPNGMMRWRALPDGAARLGADGEIVLVGPDGETVQVLHEHGGPVTDVDVAPDGTWAVSAGDGPTGELYRWDVDPATGRWLSPDILAGHSGAVIDVGIADGGERLVSTSGDTTAISWRMGADAGSAGSFRTMDPAGLVDVACGIVGRDFTQVEWERYLGERPYEPTCSDQEPG